MLMEAPETWVIYRKQDRWFKRIFIDIQTSNKLIQMYINKKMENRIDGEKGSSYILKLVASYTLLPFIVLLKMFSRWFYANKKIIITLKTSKVGDVT